MFNLDFYKTRSFTKCFHMSFIIIVNCCSLMSYFPYVTGVHSQDRILLFRQCLLDFWSLYSAIHVPFPIGGGALEYHLPIQFLENKEFRKIKQTSTAVQVCTLNVDLC